MDLCKHCGLPMADHNPSMKHRFTPEGIDGVLPQKTKEGSPGRPSSNEPAAPRVQREAALVDLPLRVAMLRAGVITPDQLAQAEQDVKTGGVLLVVPTL